MFLPRIILSESVTKHPFTLETRQFPIRLCYAMTINKSQGQSLKGVVLYLPQPAFTHGQLYVGLSRVTTKSGLKIIQGKDQKIGRVKNIVYKEIYNGLPGKQILFATQFTTLSKNTQLLSLSPPESRSDDHPEQASRNLQQLSIP
uniref:ATP-dependent DNA helicase n=1 Tax=Brassica oleracea var. oleracea TaxID=109376 RepID=A0A0D3A348_BRAOL